MVDCMRHACTWPLLVLLVACTAHQSRASVIDVGPTQPLKLPSEAAAIAKPGDTVRIAPGVYTDCAVWHAGDLTIEGTGPGATIAGKSCAGKGIFILQGNDVIVRNLTFAHAAVPAHNGAGIRAEGHNLTIQDSHFIDNENGILAAMIASGTIRVLDSEFRGNGKCDPQCAHGIYVGGIQLLDIERSRFLDQHQGHHIKSRALRTIIIANDIADGPIGNSSYLVDIPNGGDLLMQDNTLEKGPHSENSAAISIGAEGVKNPTNQLIIRGNTFTNDMGRPTIFVHNRTTTAAMLSGNQLHGVVAPLVGPGTVSP
jgi:parallel beta helix pectate lyase-like protein